MSTYWDTSCVIKLYCREEDSSLYLHRVAQAAEPLLSSVLMASEIAFAFHQKEVRGEVEAGAASLLDERFSRDVQRGRFVLLPFGEDVREEARRIATICYASAPPVPLRTLDGLHLASAQLSACREVFTTDSRMRSAAVLLGMKLG
jgi:predicted nucleic acid-binding protein